MSGNNLPAPAALRVQSFNKILIGTICLAALLGYLGQVIRYLTPYDRLAGIIPFFDLDNEGNLPSWISTSLLFVSSLLLWWTASAAKRLRAPDPGFWRLLCAVFLYLSLDEATGIHEQCIPPLRSAFHTSGALYFPWVIPAAILVLVFGICSLGFLSRLASPTRNLMLAGCAVYLFGALGMEMMSGWYLTKAGEPDLFFVLITHLEETLEMFGTLVFINALFRQIKRMQVGIAVPE